VSDDFTPGQRPGDLEVVVLPGEIDVSNAQLVLAALAAVIRRGVRLVVVDMSGTVFCDCSGVAAFAAAWRQAATAGTDLRIVITHRQVQRLFELTGLDQLLAVHAAPEPGGQRPAPVRQLSPEA
jgi:anti-sigma B factor antagonist